MLDPNNPLMQDQGSSTGALFYNLLLRIVETVKEQGIGEEVESLVDIGIVLLPRKAKVKNFIDKKGKVDKEKMRDYDQEIQAIDEKYRTARYIINEKAKSLVIDEIERDNINDKQKELLRMTRIMLKLQLIVNAISDNGWLYEKGPSTMMDDVRTYWKAGNE